MTIPSVLLIALAAILIGCGGDEAGTPKPASKRPDSAMAVAKGRTAEPKAFAAEFERGTAEKLIADEQYPFWTVLEFDVNKNDGQGRFGVFKIYVLRSGFNDKYKDLTSSIDGNSTPLEPNAQGIYWQVDEGRGVYEANIRLGENVVVNWNARGAQKTTEEWDRLISATAQSIASSGK